jgi:hypothetical protein
MTKFNDRQGKFPWLSLLPLLQKAEPGLTRLSMLTIITVPEITDKLQIFA